jgi:hypothetical protein
MNADSGENAAAETRAEDANNEETEKNREEPEFDQ